MRFVEAEGDSPRIKGLTHTLSGDRCTLQWLWPSGVEAVYIGKAEAEQAAFRGTPDLASLKLYTRAEYKSNNGYHIRLEGIGRYRFTVYIYEEGAEDGKVIWLQSDGLSELDVSASRAKIRYSVKQKTGFLQRYKTVSIQVTAEVPIAKDVLCYVKKAGGYPASKDDGMMYPFAAAFASGRNVLPPIEVGKQDFVRVFFTDGPRFAQLYELVPE